MLLQFEHRVPVPREAVFRFHEAPANLAMLLRNWPGFRLLRHDANILPGTTTWFEQTIARCVPVVLGFRHTIYEPPYRFAEELIHGPFRRFTHTHEFEAAGEWTLMRDILEVELPWQYGGQLGTRLFVTRPLRGVFAHRHRALDWLVASGVLCPVNMATNVVRV